MPARAEGFDHVHLWVADLAVAQAFYEAALGAEVAFRVGNSLVFVRLAGGEIVSLDARPAAERSPLHVGLRLQEGEDLDRSVEAIVGAGGRLVERGEHAPGVPYAYVADPDGNVFEL